MSPLLKNLIIALGLAAIAWLGYTLFIAGGEDAGTVYVTSEATRDAQEFLTKLDQLQAISLDDSLFSDNRFKSLIDLRQDVVPEDAGRPNPFTDITDVQ
jgi:hypothetical protein